MADQNKPKEGTPPPLLLMPASSALTLTPASGANLLMPALQQNTPLFTPDDGETDSFVGQSPVSEVTASSVSSIPSQQSTSSLFASTKSTSDSFAVDPFAQPPAMIPASISEPLRPLQQSTPVLSTASASPIPSAMPTPPRAGMPPPPQPTSNNMFRMSGPKRYAQMPESMYGGSPQVPPSGPSPPSFPPPLMTSGVPSSYSSPPVPPATSLFYPPSSEPPSVTSQYEPSHGSPYFGDQSINPPPASLNAQQSFAGYTSHGDETSMNYSEPHMTGEGPIYVPVTHHWFYSQYYELRQLWKPFSVIDSVKLEEVYLAGGNEIVSVEGGRYDIDMTSRTRTAIFWQEDETKVKRCSWFYRPEGESRFVPYEEQFSEQLETEYKLALTTNTWHKRLEFPGGETIVMHNQQVIVHFHSSAQPDEWGTTQGDQMRPQVVKRGIEEFENIEEGEPERIDHVVFVVHGIGSTCDLRFRNIIECVDDFRSISLTILKSHFNMALEHGQIGRVEFLPVRWHEALHGDATGVDRKLKAITLNSIGKLRHYTNDTLTDILFYTSPKYCQKIADTVGEEITRLQQLFMERNPHFLGKMSVAGHSLGSLILFDLLSHQGQPNNQMADQSTTEPVLPSTANGDNNSSLNSSRAATPSVEEASESEQEINTLEELLSNLKLSDFLATFQQEQIDMETLKMCEDSDIKEMGIPLGPRKKIQSYLKKAKQKERELAEKLLMEPKITPVKEQLESKEPVGQSTWDPVLRRASSQSVNYVVGGAGTGSPLVQYPQLNFSPSHFFALGSPIAMFLTVRGVDHLGDDFQLPTCPSIFNIFHPYDPVAYRLEPLVTIQVPPKPVLMPHHMGRKRLHLELKESIARMGADIKQKIMDSVKSTWRSINQFALAHRTQETVQDEVQEQVDSIMSSMEQEDMETSSVASVQEEDVLMCQLNQGRRIDYVLQEKPIESFNDYLFALGSHACYWESEDTVLMILKEVYSLQGVYPQKFGKDRQVPPIPTTQWTSSPLSPPGGQGHMAMMPLGGAAEITPGSSQSNVLSMQRQAGPPPLSGFVRAKQN